MRRPLFRTLALVLTAGSWLFYVSPAHGQEATEDTDPPTSLELAHRAAQSRTAAAYDDARAQTTYPPFISDAIVQKIAAGRVRLNGSYSGVGPGSYTDCRYSDAVVSTVGLEPAGDANAEELDRWDYRFEGCDRLFDRIEEAAEPKRVGTGPWELKTTPVRWRLDGRVVLAKFCQEQFTCPNGSHARYRRVDSLVGPILSVRTRWSSMEAGGPPYSGEETRTIDLRDDTEAELTTVIDEESLYRALRKDSWVQENLPDEKLDAVDDLADLAEAIRHHIGEFGTYAFYNWDADKGKVAMRIWFRGPTAGFSPNRYSSLGVWVTPKAEFETYFEAAAEGRGFYMSSEDRPEF